MSCPYRQTPVTIIPVCGIDCDGQSRAPGQGESFSLLASARFCNPMVGAPLETRVGMVRKPAVEMREFVAQQAHLHRGGNLVAGARKDDPPTAPAVTAAGFLAAARPHLQDGAAGLVHLVIVAELQMHRRLGRVVGFGGPYVAMATENINSFEA